MWVSRGMTSIFRNFNTWWGQWSALRCGHCTLGIQLNARLGGSHTGPGRFGVGKNPFASTKNVTTIYRLSRLYPGCYIVCLIPDP